MEILKLIGLVIFIIGGIWYLIETFRESIWWGLGCMFLPFIEVIFLFVHWNVAAKPFGVQVLGGILMLVASFLQQ